MHNLPDKWIEINLDAVETNLQTVRSLLSEGTRLIAVIKADAYGHGAVGTAQFLRARGVDYFAVSYFQEAMQLRRAGITEDILIFCPLIDEFELQTAVEHSLTITVASWFDWQQINSISSSADAEIKIHLKVDTGLGRFGLSVREILELIPKIKANARISIEGIYTHMATAASNSAYTRRQFKKFRQLLFQLEAMDIIIPLRHCANSAVLLQYPQMQLDAVRIGTLLSGQVPVGIARPDLMLEDPYCFKTKIISLRQLEKGSYLAYYRSYRLSRAAQVAVIPVGFNDGLALQVGNKASGWLDLFKTIIKTILLYGNVARFSPQVMIRGCSYPVRGKVFMQMALVEIPLGQKIEIGDEVVVPIRKTLAAASVRKIYRHHGDVVKISTKGGGMNPSVEFLLFEA